MPQTQRREQQMERMIERRGEFEVMDSLIPDDQAAADYYDRRVESLERDADTYQDWLTSHMGGQSVKFGPVPREEDRFEDFLETLTVCELVMFASVYAGSYRERAGKAMREVWKRYAKDQGVTL